MSDPEADYLSDSDPSWCVDCQSAGFAVEATERCDICDEPVCPTCADEHRLMNFHVPDAARAVAPSEKSDAD